MTCTEFLVHLDDLLDDTLDGADVRTACEEHMGACEHCTITVSTTRKTIEVYRSHEIYDLPAGLRERLHAAILAKCRRC